jgi:hypothetical protein
MRKSLARTCCIPSVDGYETKEMRQWTHLGSGDVAWLSSSLDC